MTIKTLRKKLVVRIHKILEKTDQLSAAWLERTKLLEDLKSEPMIPVATCVGTADSLIPEVPIANEDDPEDYHPEKAAYPTENKIGLERANDHQSQVDTNESERQHGKRVDIAGDSNSDSITEKPRSPPATRRNAAVNTDEHVLTYRTPHRVRHTGILPQWQPQTHIFEDNTHIIVAAEVPGMTLDDFYLQIVDHHLLILSQKPGSIREQFAYRRGEPPSFGTLDLKIRLPPNIHLQGDASYEDGILQVRFPKQRRQRPRSMWHLTPHRKFWDPFGGRPVKRSIL